MAIPATRSLIRASTGALLGVALLGAPGCSSPSKRSSATLTAADFRAPDADTAVSLAVKQKPSPTYATEPLDQDPNHTFEVLQGAPRLAPPPPTSPNAAASTGPAVMMDALIGDINGKPLYASEFFAPIEARLQGIKGNEAAWRNEAQKIIGTQLINMVRDELLLAEARAALSPEQKQGLLNFIETVRRDLVSRGGGGQAAVDEALREQGEKGLDAKLKENIDRQLIYANLREKIFTRATVSWHEVQVEYDKRAEKFNPDPTATFRMIRVPTKDAALVQTFTNDIARGVPFDELAALPGNDYRPADGGLYENTFKGDFTKAPLFGPKELNDAAQKLQPGGVTPATVQGEYTAWIKLEKINTPRAMSIYEAQLSIYNELRDRKVNAETDKYLADLLGKQSYTKIKEMGDKLLEMAFERYFNRRA